MGIVSNALLRDWYQPERRSICSENKVLGKLRNLELVPEQQAIIDAGVRLDQASQPYNDMLRRLISSIVAYRQVSVLLLTNADQMADHRYDIDRLMSDAHRGVLLAPREGDVFGMDYDPRPMAMGDLSPSYSGLVFPGTEPSQPDLSAFLMDGTVPQDVRERVRIMVNESHDEN